MFSFLNEENVTMDQHVGEALLTVKYATGKGAYNKETRQVTIDGVLCNASDVSTCFDQSTTMVWGTIDTSCDVRFRQIYAGNATLIEPHNKTDMPLLIIYNTKTSQQMGFTLRRTQICAFKTYRTQFPRGGI